MEVKYQVVGIELPHRWREAEDQVAKSVNEQQQEHCAPPSSQIGGASGRYFCFVFGPVTYAP